MADGAGHKMKTYSSEASQSFAHSPIHPFSCENAAMQSVSTQAVSFVSRVVLHDVRSSQRTGPRVSEFKSTLF